METKMAETQEPMSMQGNMASQGGMSMQDHMPKVVYWLENQLTVTYQSNLDISNDKTSIIESLQLQRLNDALGPGYFLQSFSKKDVSRPPSSIEGDDDDEPENVVVTEQVNANLTSPGAQENNDLNSPVGKYLFGLPPDEGTLVVSFFHIKQAAPNRGESDNTRDIVNLINNKIRLTMPIEDAQLLEALPNWLNGCTDTDIISHGCPVIPPIPTGDACDSGRWKITLPRDLPDSLQQATGAGVTVFVLDTLPRRRQVRAAAKGPGADNKLLQDIYEKVKFNYHFLSDDLDVPDPKQPATGKDIYGRLVGFPMNDHGVFVTGIVRDLVPAAKVECVRVLNDYGIGNTAMLTKALEDIHKRMLRVNPDTKKKGDLYNKPVVINMSLVATPANEDLANLGYTEDSIKPARLGLLRPIQALTTLGVVFAASAGNDSDPRDKDMNPSGQRWKLRYPAAFAYPLDDDHPGVPSVIPVGAVNRAGNAASYSNYPGSLGIATYGGEIPNPIPAAPDSSTVTQVKEPIDALRGVYSAELYPGLSKKDILPFHSPAPVDYPEYRPTLVSTWAYWVGTSFATPIISALAARILENQASSGDNVRQALISSAPQQVNWTRLEPDNGSVNGPMIMVGQECESYEDFVEVDVTITEVDITYEA
jgi:hypothetical protein